MLKGRKTIQFISIQGSVVDGEFASDSSIVERKAGQLVHLRSDERNPVCTACGCHAAFWLDAEWRHERHPARCTAVMATLKAAAA